MPNKIPTEYQQRYIGLLTHEQKQVGYFVSQDDDFIYLFHRNNGHPRIVATFLYETATIKEIRERAALTKL